MKSRSQLDDSIPFSQVQDIIANPEDAKDPWFYLRSWAEKTSTLGEHYNIGTSMFRKAWYPDWQYRPTSMKKRRIADAAGDIEGLLDGAGRATRRLGDVEPGAQRGPLVAILSSVDRGRRGSEDQLGREPIGQLERGLAP